MTSGDGRLVAGRYRLVARIGAGGTGRVWRAVDTMLDRAVAVKELTVDAAVTEAERRELARGMLDEARRAAALDNPAIVPVYDVVVDDDRPWIVMKLIPGASLQQRVDVTNRMSIAETARLGLRLVDALAAAHAAGIAHRDVKPGNVLLDADGDALLTDFSIARHVGGEATAAGMFVGSPGFIAPERIDPHLRGRLDDAAVLRAGDMFGLGATLYYAVEGRPPFPLGTDALGNLLVSAREPYRRPRHAGGLTAVLDGLLAKDVARRLSATEARRMLAAFVSPAAASAASAARAADPAEAPAAAPTAAPVASTPPPRVVSTPPHVVSTPPRVVSTPPSSVSTPPSGGPTPPSGVSAAPPAAAAGPSRIPRPRAEESLAAHRAAWTRRQEAEMFAARRAERRRQQLVRLVREVGPFAGLVVAAALAFATFSRGNIFLALLMAGAVVGLMYLLGRRAGPR